ncbi:CMD domain-containing protein [Pseudomonas sp. DSP3-2-2]|uniref:CMD domain-containing protein n=1 Tax=unclassified Pseudomonas TaxID=196821 RepID=UPI003CF8A33E
MNSTVEHTVVPDVLDDLLGIAPGSHLRQVRHARDKVVAATQGSHALFFNAQLQDGLPLNERLLVAYYTSRLTPNELLTGYYLEQLQALNIDQALLAQIDADALASLGAPRLQAVLGFTRTLILSPVEGDQQALQVLQQAGLSTAEIVVLAQLIAFLSYQVRLAAGLSALSSAGVA